MSKYHASDGSCSVISVDRGKIASALCVEIGVRHGCDDIIRVSVREMTYGYKHRHGQLNLAW